MVMEWVKALIVSILRNEQNANRTECKEGDLNSDFKTGKI